MAQTKEEIAARNKAYYKAYYEANKEKIAARDKAYYAANKEEIAASQRAYREANKERIKARDKAYCAANKERIKAYVKANREKITKRHKAYAKANKERVAAYDKAYVKANREKITAKNAKRRALKLKQIPVHLRDCPQEKQRLLQTYKLRNILTEATGVQHHVDHMWPLADGGPHWSGNLQVIPAEENLSKSASVCEETKATIIKSLYTFDTSSPI